jgi:hypothetical protein
MQFSPKQIHWFLCFCACLLACGHSLPAGQPPASLPKVLLIGDSISMAYHKIVVRELEGLEQGWFWDDGAKPVITAGQVAHEIHTAHSRNANFLLNVGPDRQGRIIDASRKVLAEIPVSRKGQP